MDIPVFEQLQKEGIIAPEALGCVREHEKSRPVSVHWDLRVLLYLSILLMTSGLGILLYKNIDTIGHASLVFVTGALCAVCFVYCFKKRAPFGKEFVPSPNLWFDYILLLGCLLMLAFVGYIQYQYQAFGEKWGLATFIPMVFLFFFAYLFDHKGVLSLAVTNLGAWMGIAVEPTKLMWSSALNDEDIVINGVILGLLLHLFYLLSLKTGVKRHFAIVYRNFGVHVLFISLIACMMEFRDWYLLWFVALVVVTVYQARMAYVERSLYFLVVSVLYGYVGLSYVVVRLINKMDYSGDGDLYCMIFYFIASGLLLARQLMHFNKLLKKHDSI